MAQIFLSFSLLALILASGSSMANTPPGYSSYNDQTECQNPARILAPRNIGELQSIVRQAYASKTRVRFIGALHSTSSLICGTEIVIRSTAFNRILGIERLGDDTVVHVESGVSIGELAEYLDRTGYTLGFAYPDSRLPTVGGVLGTGVHGSSLKHPALISQLLREVTLVSAKGDKLIVSDPSSKIFRAAKTNLGLLGFVAAAKFKVYPQFNVEMRNEYFKASDLINERDKTVRWGHDCEHELYSWFPSIDRFVRLCGNKTSRAPDAGAENMTLANFPEGAERHLMSFAAKLGKNNKSINCKLEETRFGAFEKEPPLVQLDKDGEEVFTTLAVGPSHKMLTSRTEEIPESLDSFDWSLSFAKKDSYDVLSFIKTYVKARRLCFPFAGIVFRFANRDDGAMIAHVEGGKEGEERVMLEFFDYMPSKAKKNASYARDTRYYGEVHGLVRELISRFGAAPHWGKNAEWVFRYANLKALYNKDWEAFKQTARELDPDGMFSNEFTDSAIFHR
ncbi:MAG: FAD-binding protein [Bdellovibrionota bacterium]